MEVRRNVEVFWVSGNLGTQASNILSIQISAAVQPVLAIADIGFLSFSQASALSPTVHASSFPKQYAEIGCPSFSPQWNRDALGEF